ncbi:MAG: MMPL family transporter [Clostridiales bacterium]|jgi:predicted RND superfamily exporter protein|nr:MMPL family transporter [Clostridiales bacterium]
MVDKLADGIVKYRGIILTAAVILTVIAAICSVFVKVNYDTASYLPEESETQRGLSAMYSEFGAGGNASVMLKGLSYDGIISAKKKIAETDGVSAVVWLDDMLSVVAPEIAAVYNADCDARGLGEDSYMSDADAVKLILALPIVFGMVEDSDLSDSEKEKQTRLLQLLMTDTDAFGGFSVSSALEFKPYTEMFYKDGAALLQVAFTGADYDDKTVAAIDGIRALGYDTAIIGNAATVNNSIKVMDNETMTALVVVSVIILIILFICSSSLWEPVLYLASIGVGVVINMGTNLILGSISYITYGVAAILQMALTLDYSIFLLHRFEEERARGLPPGEAMKEAVKRSFSTICASMFTTVSNFVALMFMSYGIGLDMGIVLSKGVLLSLLSVFLVLPGLTVFTYKLIDKTKHRTFSLKLNGMSSALIKSRKVLPFVFIAVIAAAFVLQTMNDFEYGNEATFAGEGSVLKADREAIEGVFGSQNQLAVLLDGADDATEAEITAKIAEVDGVIQAQSYAAVAESGFADFLPPSFMAQFRAGGSLSRMVVYIDASEEGERTEAILSSVRGILDGGGCDYYLLGASPSVVEIRGFTETDYTVITAVSVILVFLVLAFTFRSLLIPLLLIFVIEGSIFINMAIPYLSGQPIVFIGYMLISAILLGATIDYAILFMSNYLEARRMNDKGGAVKSAIAQSSKAVFVSATILTCAGFYLGLFSDMRGTSVFGTLLGRGAVCSFAMVMLLLPQLAYLFDGALTRSIPGGGIKFPGAKTVREMKLIRQCAENEIIAASLCANAEAPVDET